MLLRAPQEQAGKTKSLKPGKRNKRNQGFVLYFLQLVGLFVLLSLTDEMSRDSNLKSYFRRRNEKLKEELRKCQAALKDMVESKEELETNLYEQFLPILQSKQDKIRELKGMGRMTKANDEDSYGSSTDVD